MNWNSHKRHHAEPDDDEDEYYYTGHGSDDGYDAIRDANAEMGLDSNDHRGFGVALDNGWIRKVKKDSE